LAARAARFMIAARPPTGRPASLTLTFEESFCACEEEALRFLVAEHGFRRAAREVDKGSGPGGVHAQVVYQATDTDPESGREVVLSIAPMLLALNLQIASTGSGAYTIEELHALDGKGPFPQRMHGLYDAMHEPEQLLAEFVRLAGALQACGRRFLNDEPSLWDDLLAERERHAEAEHIKDILGRAKEAFHGRDWLGVVALLAPLEARLGRRASARLAYARRRALEER
jgi:hypothetical protein